MKSNRQILLDITITRILVMKFSLTILEILSLDSFKRTIDKTLEKYVPLKRRYVRAKLAPFMNKNK